MEQDFNYHTHTKRCGHAEEDFEDEEYIKETIAYGLKHMAFTDHMPYADGIEYRKRQRMGYHLKEDYLTSITKLKQKYKDTIDIKVGFEVEYVPSMYEHLLALKRESDIIILGQHIIEKDNKIVDFYYERDYNNRGMGDDDLEIYGDSVIKAIELGIPNIIAHPDLFIAFRENFGEKEENVSKRICEAVKKYDIPVEINLCKMFKMGNPEKQLKYPNEQFWKIAAKYNLKTVYGADVHNRGQIAKMGEYVELANTIIGKENIKKLNFVGYNL